MINTIDEKNSTSDITSNLVIWLNASSLELENKTEIDEWPSKSPGTITGKSYLYGTAKIRPKYYNNEEYPFVRMSDSSGGVLNGSFINFGNMDINASSGITIAFCIRPMSLHGYERYLTFVITNPEYSYGIWISRNNTSNNFQVILLDSSGAGALGNWPMYNNNNIVNKWIYFAVRINAVSCKINDISGMTTYTPISGISNFVTNNTKIGACGPLEYPTDFPVFDIRDFLYYDRFLSDSEIDTVINNFKSSYGM